MSFKSLFRGFFTGGMLGFLGGLILAPKPGEETRKELSEKGKAFSEKWNKVTGNLNEAKEKIFSKISTMKGDEPNEKGF